MSHAPFAGQSLCDGCADEPPSYTIRAIRNTLRDRIALESTRGHAAERQEPCAAPVAAPPAQPVAGIPMRLPCPGCHRLHIDEGEFASKPHHTHSCQHCGLTWRPAVVATVGVEFLPGFKNEAQPVAAEPAVPVAGEPTVTRAHRVKALLARFGGNVAEADRVGWLDKGDDVDPYERELERIAVAIALAESAALAQVEALTRAVKHEQDERAELFRAQGLALEQIEQLSVNSGLQKHAYTQLNAELTAANERAARLEERNAFLEEVVIAERKERLGCTDEEARDLGTYLRNQNAEEPPPVATGERPIVRGSTWRQTIAPGIHIKVRTVGPAGVCYRWSRGNTETASEAEFRLWFEHVSDPPTPATGGEP